MKLFVTILAILFCALSAAIFQDISTNTEYLQQGVSLLIRVIFIAIGLFVGSWYWKTK